MVKYIDPDGKKATSSHENSIAPTDLSRSDHALIAAVNYGKYVYHWAKVIRCGAQAKLAIALGQPIMAASLGVEGLNQLNQATEAAEKGASGLVNAAWGMELYDYNEDKGWADDILEDGGIIGNIVDGNSIIQSFSEVNETAKKTVETGAQALKTVAKVNDNLVSGINDSVKAGVGADAMELTEKAIIYKENKEKDN